MGKVSPNRYEQPSEKGQNPDWLGNLAAFSFTKPAPTPFRFFCRACILCQSIVRLYCLCAVNRMCTRLPLNHREAGKLNCSAKV